MMFRTLFCILVVTLLLAAASTAFSQRNATGPVFASDKPRPVADPEFNDRVMMARNLMKRREYMPASGLLESLYQQYRSNEVVYNLLRDCYTMLGFWPKLESLTRRFADIYPRHYRYQLFLGEALSKVGKKEESLAAYKKAISLVGRNEERAIGLVLDKMLADGHSEAAVALIDSLRAQKSDSTAFAMQRGIILEGHKRYTEAAMEFFSLLHQDHQLAVKAEKRIYSLLSFPESSEDVQMALLAQTETAANVRTFRVLSSYYLSVDNFERAAYFAVKQDSAEGCKGQPLVTFMRSCRDRKLYTEAVDMAAYILARYDKGPFLADTYFTYAQALTALGRYDEALAVYDSISVEFTHVNAMAEAVYRIGEIFLDHLNLPETALVYFDSIITHYPRGVPYLDALMAVPHAYLRQGDLKKSGAALKQLGKRQLSDDMMEQVDFHLALVLFFEKQFDSARAGFQKLMVDYPRGFYVNDALELLLLMDEAETAPELLYDYSNALLFEERRLLDSTVARLDGIVDAENKAIADIALYRLATILLNAADTSAALGKIDRLADEFPESYYLPYGMKTKADVYFLNPDNLDEAREIYQYLLENYPEYPFISEIRKRMRQADVI